MSIDEICAAVALIQKNYAEKDPYALCRAMKIALKFKPMGTDSTACKGLYLLHSREQTIVINSDLSEELQRIILAHELGHAALHRKLSVVNPFRDFAMFETVRRYEYEANLFAADYLIDDNEVIDLLTEALTFFDVAKLLNVPAEFLDFKFRVLQWKGYNVIDPPLGAKSDFLKNVR